MSIFDQILIVVPRFVVWSWAKSDSEVTFLKFSNGLTFDRLGDQVHKKVFQITDLR